MTIVISEKIYDKKASQILDESDIELISAETIDEAAKKAVGLVS